LIKEKEKMSNPKIPVIMDVDTGVDDALALLLAVESPELDLIGCTAVAGNATVEQTTRNTLAVLEIAGRNDIPVASGAARPLNRRLTTATYFHGKNGLGNVEIPDPRALPHEISAPQYLCEMVDRTPGELTLIAVGPLTNLALALALDPQFGRKLGKLIIMGGAVGCPGNITPVAEANFFNDPEAADIVMRSGADIVLVGLDVTHKTVVRWSEISHLEGSTKLTPASKFALDILRFYSHPYGEAVGAHLHDPLAVGVAVNPAWVTTQRMQVAIETAGQLTRGQSVGYKQLAIDEVVDMGDYDDAIGIRVEHPSNAEVCLTVDAPAFVRTFRERLGLV
jgi:purine nucleosidase